MPATDPVASVTPADSSVIQKAELSVLVDLNVRAGPGVKYERRGYLSEGATAVITGRDPQSEWYKIACPADVGEGECWVAGGPQFVTVTGADLVQSVPVPATPTADAPRLAEPGGRLAYVSGGQLYFADLELGNDLPELATPPLRLTESAALSAFSFSPDGQYIAYLSEDDEGNSLHVVQLNGREPTLLVTSQAIPAPEGDAGQKDVLIDEMEWLPDSREIVFNTALAGTGSGGLQSQEDLWSVTISGDLRAILAASDGGGSVTVLSQEQALLGRADELLRADLSRSVTEGVLAFPIVNTASEYAYYPRPQVTKAGAFVSIPAGNPWEEGAQTSLWQIPTIGQAVLLGQLENVHISEPVVWAEKGDRTAFVQQSIGAGAQLPRLLLADAKGDAAEPYTGGEGLRFFAWSRESQSFLYAGAGFYAVGRMGAPAQQMVLEADQQTGTAVWAAEERYLVSVGSVAAMEWHIKGGNANGRTNSLITLRGESAPFAVWLAPTVD